VPVLPGHDVLHFQEEVLSVGKKGLANRQIELKLRISKEVELVPLGEVVQRTKETIRDLTPKAVAPRG
jgi:hypothetical protein